MAQKFLILRLSLKITSTKKRITQFLAKTAKDESFFFFLLLQGSNQKNISHLDKTHVSRAL